MTEREERGREASGGLLVALASGQFGGMVVLGKLATDRGLPVASMLAVRFGLAALLLLLALVAGRSRVRPPRGELAPLLLLGAAGYGVEAGLFFLAVERGTASAVTLLFFTYPVIVTVLSAALGLGRPTRVVAGSLAAAVAGAAIVVASAGDLGISSAGVAFAFAAAAVYSAYLVGVERWVALTAPLASAMWVSAAASAFHAAIAASSRQRLPQGEEWWLVAGMGAFTAGAFLCLLAGIRRIGAVRTAIVAALEPLTAAFLGIVFLDEPFRAGIVGGGVLILGGAISASLVKRRAAPQEGAAP